MHDIFPDLTEVRSVINDNIFVNISEKILHDQAIIDDVLSKIFLFIDKNEIFLENQDDFNLDPRQILALSAILKQQAKVYPKVLIPPLNFFLNKICIFQQSDNLTKIKQSMKIQQAKLKLTHEKEKIELARKLREKEEHWEETEKSLEDRSKNLDIAMKESELAKEEKNKLLKENEARISELEKQMESSLKLFNDMKNHADSLQINKLDDLKKIDELNKSLGETKTELDKIKTVKAAESSELETKREDIANEQNELTKKLNVEKASIQKEMHRIKKERDEMELKIKKQYEDFTNQSEIFTSCNENLIKENKELRQKLLNEVTPKENDLVESFHLIAVDLNNMEKSKNDKTRGLRLFTIDALFQKIYDIIVQNQISLEERLNDVTKNDLPLEVRLKVVAEGNEREQIKPDLKYYKILGYIFCSENLRRYENMMISCTNPNLLTFSKMFKWQSTNFKKGVQQNGKPKLQDADGMMLSKTTEILVLHKSRISSLVIGSGDIDMMPLVMLAKESNIPVHVVAVKESLSKELSNAVDSVTLW